MECGFAGFVGIIVGRIVERIDFYFVFFFVFSSTGKQF